MTYLPPGTPVLLLGRFDERHRHGIVSTLQNRAWDVWVEHQCDCWTPGVIAPHVRGYTTEEVQEVTT